MRGISVAIILSAVAFAFTSCRSPEVLPTSENTYVISGSSHFSSGMGKKADIIRMANDFAASRGKVAVAISLKEHHPAVGHAGQFEYQFKLEDPGSPEAQNDSYAELIRLNELRIKGVITEEEFNAKKRQVLEL